MADEQARWGSSTLYILVLICQTIGLNTSTTLPNKAVAYGALASLAVYAVTFLVLGVPLLYMEMIIGQFTSRDCIAIWRIRPFLSHVGYFLVAWQVIILFCNHCASAFALHYFIISFERTIPYFTCGRWANSGCNALLYNYSLNLNCIRSKTWTKDYCKDLHETYSVYQYWRYNMLSLDKNTIYLSIAWRVCLSSVILCLCVFLCCFRRDKSLQYFIWILTLYPSVAYVIFLIGCLVQKGLVMNLTSAMDGDFSHFSSSNGKITHAVVYAVYTVATGSGISFNLAATCPFRAPCYVNAVVPVVVCVIFTSISVFVTCMALCPYSFEYHMDPLRIAVEPLTFLHEKMPLLLNSFEGSKFYLLLLYSSNTVLALRTTAILFFNVQELLANRYLIVARYPGLFSFVGVSVLFVGTIPMLSSFGISVVGNAFRQYVNLTSLFMIMLECFVFVLWYGLGRFSEDVHFMLGVQPSKFMKVVWVGSIFFFGYVTGNVIYTQQFEYNFTDILGCTLLLLNIGGMLFLCVFKLLYAACRGRFREAVSLDPTWGPESEVLKRSRAMFTGQAMTKEYLYRQYHLQAGILARQRRSNKRMVESP